MNFINNIKTETLIICNPDIKKMILKEHKLLPIKFMTAGEFKEKYLFRYDERAILYLVKKYLFKYDIAKEYIDNMYYVLDDKMYKSDKLNFLVALKKELQDNNLLIINNDFKEYIKKTKIIIYDIYLDNYLLNVFKDLDYQVVERKFNNYSHQIYRFETMESEVRYIANEIAKLIDNGVSPENIKLTNVDDTYYNTITRIFSLYGLKVNIPYTASLASYPQVKEFLKLYKEKKLDINECFEKINDNSLISEELLKIINNNIKYEDKDLLIYKIKNAKISANNYLNAIDIIDYLTYITNDNEYIFMLGFNEGIIPKNYLDSNYITDNIKDEVYLDKCNILNKWQKERIMKVIGDIKNLVITYKNRDYTRNYYPSMLADNYEVILVEKDYHESYSVTDDKINLVKAYDNYFKYGSKEDNFDVLNNNYDINYNSFSNKYTKIDRIMDKLNLSYSKMQIYNKCAFKYYLTDILRLDIYEENFSALVGRMVHYVMEKCLTNNDNDSLKYANEYLKDKTFSKKETFFLEKYKQNVCALLDQVMLEKESSLFDKALYEEKIDIDYGNNIHFNGIIDKILYYIRDDKTYLSLIDYKTGNDDISLKYFKYGIDIQLPIYLYLSTKLTFKNPVYCGFYLQKFNINDQDYRLVGYSNSDKDILMIADKNYDNSKIIKGLKTLKDGSFAKSSKVLSNKVIDKIIKDTELMILTVISKIKDNNFEINPKIDNDKKISCEYCKFRDICFVKSDDYIKIESQEFGGDA